jgi:hypothetical protein
MDWSRSETLALAMHHCTNCRGSGLRLGRKQMLSPCNCVLRGIFRACYRRFVTCATQERFIGRVGLEPHCGQKRPSSWGRKDEEYIADFCLVSRRHLDESDYQLFRYHFLLGADWKLCCRRLKIERGTFFHSVYRIEQKLGRVFRELEPYALYPLNEYFYGASRPHTAIHLKPKPLGPSALPEYLRFPAVAQVA